MTSDSVVVLTNIAGIDHSNGEGIAQVYRRVGGCHCNSRVAAGLCDALVAHAGTAFQPLTSLSKGLSRSDVSDAYIYI